MAAGVGATSADRGPWEWLELSVRAGSSTSYIGTRDIVLFERGRKLLGYQQKVVRAPVYRERLVILHPAEHAGRLAVSNGRERWDYTPSANVVHHQPLAPAADRQAQQLQSLRSLGQMLRAELIGTETVAGRTCQIIALSDTRGRHVKRVWLDRATAVELKVQRFGGDGSVVSSAYFTTVDFSSAIPGISFEFEAPSGARVYPMPPSPPRMALPDAEAAAGFRAVLPRALPSGYSLIEDEAAVMVHGSIPALWLLFSNGVDSFSIFQTPARVSRDAHDIPGATVWTRGGFTFVLVGSLPRSDISVIIRSTR